MQRDRPGAGRLPPPTASEPPFPPVGDPLEVRASPGFAERLLENRVAIAFTTWDAGRLVLIGVNPRGELAVRERAFPRSMGLGAGRDGRTLWLACRRRLWRLEDGLDPGHRHEDHDRVYLPQETVVTGPLDVHDVRVRSDDSPVFVATRYSCLATVSRTHAFHAVWRPPFVSAVAPEDRCHLNGLALLGDRPHAVTLAARSDAPEGWRNHRRDGGLVLDVDSGRVLADGLSMPHSPRLDAAGRIWLCDSGRGALGFADPGARRFVPVLTAPGFLRGLDLLGRTAVVGLSKARHPESGFAGLELGERLRGEGRSPWCGLLWVDLDRGEVLEWLRIEGPVAEIYDVAWLPGTRFPLPIGLVGDEIRRFTTIEAAPDGG